MSEYCKECYRLAEELSEAKAENKADFFTENARLRAENLELKQQNVELKLENNRQYVEFCTMDNLKVAELKAENEKLKASIKTWEHDYKNLKLDIEISMERELKQQIEQAERKAFYEGYMYGFRAQGTEPIPKTNYWEWGKKKSERKEGTGK